MMNPTGFHLPTTGRVGEGEGKPFSVAIAAMPAVGGLDEHEQVLTNPGEGTVEGARVIAVEHSPTQVPSR